MRYRLPKNFKCENGELKWYWMTANSCMPPGYIKYFQRNVAGVNKVCGSDLGGCSAKPSKFGGGTFPEEYWMYADARVKGSVVP